MIEAEEILEAAVVDKDGEVSITIIIEGTVEESVEVVVTVIKIMITEVVKITVDTEVGEDKTVITTIKKQDQEQRENSQFQIH